MSNTENNSCIFCGEIALLEVLEYFPEERSLLLDTCCEAMQEQALEILPTLNRRELNAWFQSSTGIMPRQLILDSESPSWIVDSGLEYVEVQWAEAWDFVNEHHRQNDAPAGWKFGIGLRSGSELVAVMKAGRPVSKAYDHTKVVEITRVCVKNLFPHALGWNACSMLYGYACREAAKRGYKRALTYTRLDEPGASLKASGFVQSGIAKGGSWDSKSRRRANAPLPSKKRRWWRDLGSAVQLPEQLELLQAA
jgi:hypothetical protein